VQQVTVDFAAANSGLWGPVLQILAGGLLSLLSAFLASLWSVRAFRSQKWWELRIQTYLGLLENLAIIKHFYERSIEQMDYPTWAYGPNETLAGRLTAARAEVAKVAAMGALHISPKASDALDKLVALFGVDLGCGPESDFPEYLKATKECLDRVRKEAEHDLKKGRR
jgi:hypothetical protein